VLYSSGLFFYPTVLNLTTRRVFLFSLESKHLGKVNSVLFSIYTFFVLGGVNFLVCGTFLLTVCC